MAGFDSTDGSWSNCIRVLEDSADAKEPLRQQEWRCLRGCPVPSMTRKEYVGHMARVHNVELEA